MNEPRDEQHWRVLWELCEHLDKMERCASRMDDIGKSSKLISDILNLRHSVTRTLETTLPNRGEKPSNG